MLIERVKPEFIGGKDSLSICLISELQQLNIDNQEISKILSYIPTDFLSIKCFLDKITNLWRYEFGYPSSLPNTRQLLWIANEMWPPVKVLAQVLLCAYSKLLEIKFKSYLNKLTAIRKHSDSLVEMLPILRIDKNIPTDFEVMGYGPGKTNVDWIIGPIEKRLILIDVKNRMKDLYLMMDQATPQKPIHNPELIFRSIEGKYLPADPDERLQGAWIVTQVKQEYKELNSAFNALDSSKVHFAILGNEFEGACIITRRPEDEAFLRTILKLSPSKSFTYEIKL